MRAWQDRYGTPPSSTDWSRTHAVRRGGKALTRLNDGDWPAPSTAFSITVSHRVPMIRNMFQIQSSLFLATYAQLALKPLCDSFPPSANMSHQVVEALRSGPAATAWEICCSLPPF